MKKVLLILVILFLPWGVFGEKMYTLKVTENEKTRIIKALRIMSALQAGKYQMHCTASSISNDRHHLQLEMRIAGESFRMVQSFPVQKQERNNAVYLIGGPIMGFQYKRRLYSRFHVSAGMYLYEKQGLWSMGLGYSW